MKFASRTSREPQPRVSLRAIGPEFVHWRFLQMGLGLFGYRCRDPPLEHSRLDAHLPNKTGEI